MLCPEAAPCVGAGACSDSPVGEARPRFVWGECRWGSRPYTDAGLQPMPPPAHRLLPWPHSALASHRPSACWDRSCARRPLKHTAEKLARTKLFPESLPSEAETKVNSLGTWERGVFWVHCGSRQQSGAAAWRLQSTHPPGLQFTFSKL